MGLFTETPKTKAGSNNNNLKINKRETLLTELFLNMRKNYIHTVTLSSGNWHFFAVDTVCCLGTCVEILTEPRHPSVVWFH